MFSKKLHLNYNSLIWMMAGFAFTYVIYFLTKSFAPPAFKTITIFLFSGFIFYAAGYKKQYQLLGNNILKGVSLFLVVQLIYILSKTYFNIPEWDFLCFYLFGKTGISSADFYNPEVFSRVFSELNLQLLTGKEFTDEIVKVGFWYPPHSMLLFLMLGLFDLKTGYTIWQTLILAFLLIDILLLYKKYYQHIIVDNRNKLLVFPLLIVILLFPNIEGSVYFSQTISIFLFFLLLLINSTDNWKSGVYLAILITIKPLAVFFILYFIVFKKWKAFRSLCFSGIVVLIVSLLFFGYQPFLTYLTSGPTNRMPPSVYYEDLNQSLNAVLLRLKNSSFNFLNVKAIVFSTSFIVVVVTILSSRILAKLSPVLSFMVYIPMALIIYPASLVSYSILLLPIILYLYNQKLFNSNVLNLLFILLLYCIGLYSFFLLNSILWIILTNYSRVIRLVKA